MGQKPLGSFNLEEAEMTSIAFEDIEIWQPTKELLTLDFLLSQGYLESEKEALEILYDYTQSIYAGLVRKNNEPAVFHALWTAYFVAKAGGDFSTVLAALLHDVIEEQVDRQIIENQLSDPKAIKNLEQQIYSELKDFLQSHLKGLLSHRQITEVLKLVWLLTRLKKENYYESLRGIFCHSDTALKIKATVIKLADRLHNIWCLDCFSDLSYILYQIYKNLFVLNNAKELLMELAGQSADLELLKLLAKLITKCGKGSYFAVDLFLGDRKRTSGNVELYIYLSLALRKYILRENGMWQATEQQLFYSSHPSALFDGVLLKYHRKLQRQLDYFAEANNKERDYIRQYFQKLNLCEEELDNNVYLKDAMSLREIFASLMYLENYVITGFCFAKEKDGTIIELSPLFDD